MAKNQLKQTIRALFVVAGLTAFAPTASFAQYTYRVPVAGLKPVTQLTVSPTSLDFGSVDSGGSSAAKTVTVSNTGSTPVSISGISLPTGYSLGTNSCANATLAPAQQCQTAVFFSPTTAKTYSGNLAVAYADTRLVSVALTGIGLAVLPPATTSNINKSLYNLTTTGTPTLTAPFTVGAWVNITGGMGYVFSLGTYFNPQTNTLYHSGIVSTGTQLAYAWSYQLNPYFAWVTTENIQAVPAGWVYLAAEVSSTNVLKVALNGHFIYSRQLQSSVYLPYSGYVSQSGGTVGYGEPNAGFFNITGNIQNMNIWNSGVWNGQDFTPPARY